MIKNINESGRTMLEMLGVLAIMGVIMYGAIAGIQFGVDMYKVNASFNDLEELSQGITDLYSWSSGYPSGSNMGTAVDRNNITDATYRDGGQFEGRFSNSFIRIGNACSGGVAAGGANCERFYIKYSPLKPAIYNRLRIMTYSLMNVYTEESDIEASGVDPSSCSDDNCSLVLISR